MDFRDVTSDLAILAAVLGITWFVYFPPLTMTLITIEAVLASAIMLGATGRTNRLVR